MNISKNKIDSLNYQITLEVAANDYAEPLRKRLNKYRNSADIKGFRKGMAPMSMIQRFYGEQALYEAVNGLISDEIDKFIKEENIRVVGEPLPAEEQPQLDWRAGNDFTFIFDIAQTPELDFAVGKEDKIPFYEINVTEAARKKTRESMLQQYGSMQEGEKTKEDDYIIADIANDSHSAEGVYVSIRQVAEKERKKFIGVKAGDKIKVDVSKAFENETDRASMLKIDKAKLADIDPKFTFTVVNVKTFVAAEANQETWDKMFGEGAVTTDEQFEEKIVERIKAEHEQEARYRFSEDARRHFLEKAAVELPEAFLKRWLIHINEGKFTAEQVEKEFDGFVADFKWQLVRGYIMKKLSLSVSKDDIFEAALNFVAYQYAMYGMPNMPHDLLESAAKNMLEDENQHRRLEEQCEDNKTFAALRDAVTLQVKKISEDKFRELK